MRKIEQLMVKAVTSKVSWSLANTSVEYQCELNDSLHARMEQAKVYLHGNHIGTFLYRDVKFHINCETLARWPTRTTKSRLRALGATV
jgi:hypothetical protein